MGKSLRKKFQTAPGYRSSTEQQSNMHCRASQRCLLQLLREPVRSRSVPTFLVPALSQPWRSQCFSTTSAMQSRIGSSPVSVPAEVSLKFIDLPHANARDRSKEVPKMAIEVNGPLGMSPCTAFLEFRLIATSDFRPIDPQNPALCHSQPR